MNWAKIGKKLPIQEIAKLSLVMQEQIHEKLITIYSTIKDRKWFS